MRRRINTFEGIGDYTRLPHLYMNTYDGEPVMEEPPLALYDQELWAELQDAQRRLADVEARVAAAAVVEPLDEVEVAIGVEFMAMLRGQYNTKRWDELEAKLLAHAETVERKP